MSIQQITPAEAKRRIDSSDGSTYLDVRSEPEYANGHVPGALNIPLMHVDPATRQMTPNPDFLRVVHAVIDPDRKLIVGCMSGGRSQKACELMEQAGYNDLSNMRGGFGGARDSMGRVVEAGWTQLGYPVSRDAIVEASYSSLKERVAT